MIFRDTHLQTLQCGICEEVKSFTRKQASDPEVMFILVEEMTADHKDCDQWKHDPERARRERGVKRRMCREFKKLEAENDKRLLNRPRCSGRR
jgi:hypothetical protein